METVHSGGRLCRAGLVLLVCGVVLGALGFALSVTLLPAGIMVGLLGMVLVVLGASEAMWA